MISDGIENHETRGKRGDVEMRMGSECNDGVN